MKLTKFRSWNEVDNCFYYFENGKYYDADDNDKDLVSDYVFDWQNAEQYTSYLDENRKGIYENDLLEFGPYGDFSRQVIFTDGCWKLMNNEKEILNIFSSHTAVIGRVVGNIHQNPELLKGKVV